MGNSALQEHMEPRDVALINHLGRLGFDGTSIKMILAAHGRGRSRYSTRVIVFTDGTRDTVLNILARLKFPVFRPESHIAYWTSPDPNLEVIENVSVTERKAKRGLNPFGVPAGTPEYHRRYREANKDKVRIAQKRHYHKHKARVEVMQQAIQAHTPDKAAELQSRLDDIIGGGDTGKS